jgi:hypothetical protein
LKGFGIYVKNDLLEPKHVKAMGEAVWLYMWLLDKITSVNENGQGRVLGNKPVLYEEVAIDLGIHRNTYTKYIKILKSYNYIQTLRTPRGICISVNKAKKSFNKGFTRPSDSHDRVIHTKRGSDSHDQGSDSQNPNIQYKTIARTKQRQLQVPSKIDEELAAKEQAAKNRKAGYETFSDIGNILKNKKRGNK